MSEILPLATQKRLEREYEARYKSFQAYPVKSTPSSPSADEDLYAASLRIAELRRELKQARESLCASRVGEQYIFAQWREVEKERMRQEQRYKRLWGFFSLALCYAAVATFTAAVLASVVWGD